MILLESPGKDLSIIVTRSGKIIGYGDIQETGYEGVIITSKYDQNVTINVLNYDAEPARFGIRIGTIQW